MDDQKFRLMKTELLPELHSSSSSHQAKVPSLPANAIKIPGRRQSGWAEVRAMVRVAPPGEETWSMVELTRPYAVIGRKPGSDITIAHAGLEPLHIYLHFDENGCYAVDMRTHTGMRINGRAVTHGPLMSGDVLEAGGFRVLLDGMIINGRPVSQGMQRPGPLTRDVGGRLVGLQLQALSGTPNHWRINSRIAFIGAERLCAVAMPDNPAASRVHGVFVRTEETIYFVDLLSKGTHINGEHLFNGCRELFQSDMLAIGRRGFVVHRTDGHDAGQEQPGHEIMTQPVSSGRRRDSGPSNDVVLAELLNRIQTQHDDALDRQNELHVAMAQLLRQVQSEHSQMLEKQIERIQKMDAEITELKSQLVESSRSQRALAGPSGLENQAGHSPALSPGMSPEPLKPADPINLKKVKTIKSSSTAETPEYTTAWLLDRVSHLEKEQTSAWRDLLGRMRGK